MKRRGFLQAMGAAVAAVFAPTVVSKTVTSLAEKYPFTEYSVSIYLPVGRVLFVNSTNAMFGYGAGTLTRPFFTIQEAINVANSGDTIILHYSHREVMLEPVNWEGKNNISIVGTRNGEDMSRIIMAQQNS